MNNIIKRSVITLFTTALLSSTVLTNADDTDIINIEVPTNSNVLFVMDMSGSMAAEISSPNIALAPVKSRKEILHEALKTVLNAPELATLNINVGLASFAGNDAVPANNQKGHGISYPVTPLLSDAAPRLDSNALWNHQTSLYDGENVTSYLPLAGLRTSIGYMGDAIPAGWTPKGKTPIVDALYEAALYFRGGVVDFGKADPSRQNSAHPSTYTGLLYDKTTYPDIPTAQECGGTTSIVCNATVDSCPATTDIDTCFTADPLCAANKVADGYICDAPYTPLPGNNNCGLATCLVTAGCDDTVFTTPPPVTRTCPLATVGECEASTAWNGGRSIVPASCTSIPVPEAPGSCNLWDLEGDCIGTALPTPAHDVIKCKEPKDDIYQCPTMPAERQLCKKDIPKCTHTIDVPTPTRTLHGSATYNSPILEECPNNSIILLSDGKPTRNNSAGRVTSLVGALASGCSAIPDSDPGPGLSVDHAGRCGKELTKFLATTDNNTSVDGDQFITTHAIGLSLGNDPESLEAKAFLEELAFNGGGQFINASTPEGLVAALLNTITSTAKARSFTSPTYTSSALSLSHGDSVYVPVFDKSLGPVWSGNLKKYRRSGGRLVDADSLDATDPLGGLKTTARDLWSAVPSVHSVLSGGVANKLPTPDIRRLYTDAGVAGGFTFAVANELKSSNANITKALLGDTTMTNVHRDELIEFIRGKKSDGTPRNHIGDIIHSKPIFIDYGTTKRLFVGTNEGYLHAFNETTGEEQFAFMPSAVLKNIELQYLNDALANHPYGVDGPITLHHDDKNSDGLVNGTDTAVLYFGLRRGGKAYYALDVTNPLAPPVLKWKIEQGAGDFNNLGYSWSQPVVMKMKHQAGVPAEPVVVFGGGYVDDNGGEADNSGTGADVFIVKASDGSLVWKLSDLSKTTLTNAGVSVEYAVPANIRVMDITGDSTLDRLYFADTGGDVWRVDFEAHLTGTGAEKAKLKRFAELGGSAPKRKFFTEPDVALFKAQGQYLISVAIGSGQRPKPLDATTDDNFFLMFDKDIRKAPISATPTITKANLKDATAGPVTDTLSGAFRGWFMDLVALDGEKVLSRATTYNNKILFNTFGTTSISAAICGASNVNQSRLYIVDLMGAGGVIDLDGDATTDPADPADRSKKIAEGEIPGPPHIILDNPSTCVQGNCVIKDSGGSGRGVDIPFTGSKMLRRVYWIDKE